ncbi:MAG: hypothetical protein NC121_07115 [Blautia sp.]|nr:hypothetical protein [Blautia sp.]
MSNVRIGPDGTILKDDQVVSSDNRTVIGDDGTIVSTSVGGSAAPIHRGGYNAPPASPLEGRNHNIGSSVGSTPGAANTVVGSQAIKEKEYDIQMIDGRIRNAFPKQWIIATVVLCVLALMGLFFLLVPAIFTGIMIAVGFSKRSKLIAERESMVKELDHMKGNGG